MACASALCAISHNYSSNLRPHSHAHAAHARQVHCLQTAQVVACRLPQAQPATRCGAHSRRAHGLACVSAEPNAALKDSARSGGAGPAARRSRKRSGPRPGAATTSTAAASPASSGWKASSTELAAPGRSTTVAGTSTCRPAHALAAVAVAHIGRAVCRCRPHSQQLGQRCSLIAARASRAAGGQGLQSRLWAFQARIAEGAAERVCMLTGAARQRLPSVHAPQGADTGQTSPRAHPRVVAGHRRHSLRCHRQRHADGGRRDLPHLAL